MAGDDVQVGATMPPTGAPMQLDPDVSDLRAQHTLTWTSTSEEVWRRRGVCKADGHAWPCDTKIALEALDAALAAATKAGAVGERPALVSQVDRGALQALLMRVGHVEWDARDARNVTDHVMAFLATSPAMEVDEDDDPPVEVIAAALHHPRCNHRTGGPSVCDSQAMTAVGALRAAGLLPARSVTAVDGGVR